MKRLQLEEAEIIFTNFRGQEGKFNAAGERSFSVLIKDLDLAEELMAEGWALRPLKNEEGDVDVYHLPIKINFKGRRPPRIIKVSPSTGQQLQLTEETVALLDYLPIDYVDLIANPYEWSVRGESGVKAYLSVMYAVIEENELDLKWANMAPPTIGDLEENE